MRDKLLEPILAPIKKRQLAREERKKELAISFGEQDAIDILSYAGLEENVDHLCIDGVYNGRPKLHKPLRPLLPV